MRSAQVLFVIAFLGAAAVSPADMQSPAAKALPLDVGPGRVAWFDITTSDLAAAKTFYGGLFDWTFTPVPGAPQVAEIVSRGTPIGTIRAAEGPIGAFNGVVYVQVADLPGRMARAKALGATIAPGFPFNLTDGRGAVGLIADPSGHPIGMYSRTPLPPPR